MRTLRQPYRFEQEIRKSRFVAVAAPVASEALARTFIQAHMGGSANHNCWAYRVGTLYRFNDDGEPSGTAGKPILQAIDGQELDCVAVIVQRWFGGVLLGTGGLVRAYGGTAAACLRAADTIEIVPTVVRRVTGSFSDIATIKARLVPLPDTTISGETYAADGAAFLLEIPTGRLEKIGKLVGDLTGGRVFLSDPD
ncbi:YigZ family protein [Ciceribacter sp. L1K23]|uniref:IMPACT family protein n=1 Tax=Ciceribacter sp. L1K23 TaxID=2820276 RepID=UPI001B818402|nr:YigZ family protein [Ciceribacter sp. L1K23]